MKPIVVDPNTPLDLYEARNAFWIALWAGAEKDAAELFAQAERSLQKAEAFHASRAGAKQVLTAARETVQTAENARMIAFKRRSEDRFPAEGRHTQSNDGVMGGNMSTTNDLTAAIADLAKAEMAFTTDIRADGTTTYLVDSVALAEDELVLLHRKGALTQAGIRHYLVYRGGNADSSHVAHPGCDTLPQAEPLPDPRRSHLENCAECQAIAKELTNTDRAMIHPPASGPGRKKVA